MASAEGRRSGATTRAALARRGQLALRAPALIRPPRPVPVGRIAGAASTLMTDYGLASYDAVHAASAIAAGAEAIVTTDTGFARLPWFLLAMYTDRSRVPSARGRPRCSPLRGARMAPEPVAAGTADGRRQHPLALGNVESSRSSGTATGRAAGPSRAVRVCAIAELSLRAAQEALPELAIARCRGCGRARARSASEAA
jgi:hypothetical protein